MSPVPKTTPFGFLREVPYHLTSTPNGTWAIIALVLYFLFPYDLSPSSTAASGPLTWAFFKERFPFWFILTVGYATFWHVALYILGWAKRPFIKDRRYNIDKVIHNVFWTISGVVVFTCTENVIAYLWASGRLPYLSDSETFSSLGGWLKFLGILFLLPAYRAVHFYVVHRMLHFAPLYYFVHSLHHRNTDIEPFAGTSMHPVEHLYYYTSYLGSLLFLWSPFAFFWNGVHLLLSPGASHSGWEDHFQGDPFHYMHHRYFECNYSSSDAMFVDEFFGTCEYSMAQRDKDGVKARADAKATLRAVPTSEFVTYLLAVFACFALFAHQAHRVHQGVKLSEMVAMTFAVIGGAGPVISAIVMWIFVGMPNNNALAMKGPWKAIHLLLALSLNIFPVVLLCYLALRQ